LSDLFELYDDARTCKLCSYFSVSVLTNNVNKYVFESADDR